MPLPVHWVNQQLQSSLSVLDRGFAYGDGLFETLRFHRGQFHLLERHLQRLQLGCQRLAIPCPLESLHAHLALAAAYLQGREIAEASLRLSVNRGDALESIDGRGYGGGHGTPNVVFSLFPARLPWREVPEPADLICSDIHLPSQPLLAGIKHCNRLEQVLAATRVRRAKATEAVMLNQSGHPVSGIAANLFLVNSGRLYTPELLDCGVAGTVRDLVLHQLAADCMIHVEQRALARDELYQADEIILTNSLIGIQSVASLDARQFSTNAVADTLRACFFDRVDAESA